MANLPESPDAGLWEYGRQTVRQIAKAVRRGLRAIARNRAVLLGVIKMASAIVKLISSIMDLFRHS